MRKAATIVAAAALAAAIALVWHRSSGRATLRPQPQPFRPPAEPPPAPPPPASPAAAPTPVPTPDLDALLRQLADALRNGDDATARAIVDRLGLVVRPPVADPENAAPLYANALELMKSLPRKELYAVWEALIPSACTPEKLKTLRAWFESHADTMNELERLCAAARERPHCRFAGERPIVRLQELNQLLIAKAIVCDEDLAPAVRSSLSLARGLRAQRDAISFVMSSAIESQAFEAIARKPDSAALSALVDSLDAAAPRKAHRDAVLGELYGMADEYLKARANPAAADPEVREWAAGPTASDDMARGVEAIADLARACARPWCDAQGDLEQASRVHDELAPWYAETSRWATRASRSMARSAAEAEARVTVLKAARALERHRAAHGAYPADLALLGGAFRNPLTGCELDYRLELDGFVLWASERIAWKR